MAAPRIVFEDPEARLGYLEQKLAQTDEGLLIATCWTVTLEDVVDEEDSFVISRTDGLTWSVPRSTGIRGQTMTPIPLAATGFWSFTTGGTGTRES